MARPPKSIDVLTEQGTSHLTKVEIQARKAGEAAFATGRAIQERAKVKADPVAHREFRRLRALLTEAGKNDALFEAVVNRYCLLQSECMAFEEQRERLLAEQEELSRADVPVEEKHKMRMELQRAMLALDKQVQAKRKMMLDIEKECALTVASAVRNVPKKPEKAQDSLLEVLRGGG